MVGLRTLKLIPLETQAEQNRQKTTICTWDQFEEFLQLRRMYRGEWHQDGWPSGHGELFVAGKDGGTFRGTWEKGKLEGDGEFISTNGGGYSGQWSAGVKQGQGTQSWSNGMKFEGSFHQNAVAQGTLRMPSGLVRRLVWCRCLFGASCSGPSRKETCFTQNLVRKRQKLLKKTMSCVYHKTLQDASLGPRHSFKYQGDL